MTVVKLTREFVLDAIEKESRLRAGYWIDWFGESAGHDVNAEDCAVCAVGAVMRRALAKSAKATEVEFLCAEAAGTETEVVSGLCLTGGTNMESAISTAKTFVNKLPMAALSHVFETASRLYPRTFRDVTLNFVREHFPPVILVDVQGSKPASDVKTLARSTKNRKQNP